MYSHCSYLYNYHHCYYCYTTAFRRKTATTTRQEPFRWKPEIPTCPRSSKNHLTTGFRMSSQSLGMTMWLLRMAPTAQPSSAAFNCLELPNGLPGANCKLPEPPTGSKASRQAITSASKQASQQASHQVSTHASKQASKQAGAQATKRSAGCPEGLAIIMIVRPKHYPPAPSGPPGC